MRYSCETLCFLSFHFSLFTGGIMKRLRPSNARRNPILLAVLAAAGLTLGCNKAAVQPKQPASRPSDVKVEVRDGGPVVITTSAAEFQILPSGYLQATLLKDGQR